MKLPQTTQHPPSPCREQILTASLAGLDRGQRQRQRQRIVRVMLLLVTVALASFGVGRWSASLPKEPPSLITAGTQTVRTTEDQAPPSTASQKKSSLGFWQEKRIAAIHRRSPLIRSTSGRSVRDWTHYQRSLQEKSHVQ